MLLRALRDLPTSVNPIRRGDQFREENRERALDWIAGGYAEPWDAPAPAAPAPASAPAPAAVQAPIVKLELADSRLPRWDGCTVAVIASGPSLSLEQCQQVAAWRAAREDARVIVINTSFRRAPFADILYACDGSWWRAVDPETKKTYFAEASEVFPPSALWTQDAQAAKDFSLNFIASQRSSNLSRNPKVVSQGMNSALQSINLAFLAGARRFILIGVDLKGKHWHADHPSPLSNSLPHRNWRENFRVFAADLREAGVVVVNCSPGTALDAFPLGELTEELAK